MCYAKARINKMIKSEFRKGVVITFWGLVILELIVSLVLYSIISVYYFDGHIIKKGTLTTNQTLIPIGIFILQFIIIAKVLLTNAMKIAIDKNEKKIIFTHIWFNFAKTYSLKDFDSYVETEEWSKQGTFKAIYLIANKKLIRKIRGFYYSNMDELKDALFDLSNLGFRKITSLKALKIYVTGRIID